MCTERNIYRRMCRMKRKQFYKSDAGRMLTLSKTEPNKFGKEVKSEKLRHQLPDLDFFSHFRKPGTKRVEFRYRWEGRDRKSRT